MLGIGPGESKSSPCRRYGRETGIIVVAVPMMVVVAGVLMWLQWMRSETGQGGWNALLKVGWWCRDPAAGICGWIEGAVT